MNRAAHVLSPVALSAFFFLLGACGGAVEPSDHGSKQAQSTAPGAAPDGGSTTTTPSDPTNPSPPAAACCPIDDHPSCCMRYGGGGDDTSVCGTTCDGMAQPGDPGWTKGVNEHGCPVWIEPRNPAHVCGEAVIDAGTEPAVECCPPDPQPSCCMAYGGAKLAGNACGATCDGMASPSDPGWELGTDTYGCKVWKEPANPASRCGGIDAGH